jgi:hypothetical protein
MDKIILLIFFLALFFLIIGIIKPSWAFCKLRKKVILLYSVVIVLSLVLFSLINNDILRGKITYEIKFEGSDSQTINLTKNYLPYNVIIYFDNEKFRMTEKGGTNADIIANTKQKKAFLLNADAKIVDTVSINDLNESMKDKNMQKLLPFHYRPLLEKIDTIDIISGYKCRLYEVKKSGFIKPEAKAKVWITKKIIIPQMRYEFQNDNFRDFSPLPLQLGVKDGTIIKMIIEEKGVKVTYQVTNIEKTKPDSSIFILPNL